ncbi:ABC transporter ATP-binding protein [Streptomyces sp. 8L]|uniref:ABC transporter ATP-binding protein n=1 Tax=Streptomyces sp. 8L TaxID=2877242 RepID=UPI001CD210BB|nr:ABC transporter ATP-binding protein [Streptomyces sp. 8L]MCA1216986.1 ABC transporter ATP-binding protein/permease [Streptomyces sp. 8L]
MNNQVTARGPAPVSIRATDLLPTATARETRAELVARLRRAPLRPLLALLVTVANVVAGLLVPRALGRIIDVVAQGGHAVSAITGPTALVAASCLAQAVLTGWGGALVARTGEELLAGVRESALGRALAVPTERLERSGAGDLVSRVSNDVSVLADAVRSLVPQLASSVLQVALTFVALIVLDWRFAAASLLVVPLQVVAVRWLRRTSRPVRVAERLALGEQTRAILESTEGAPTVRAFRLEKDRLELVGSRSRRSRDLALRATQIGTRFFGKLNGAEWTGLSALLAIGWLLVRDGDVPLGTASAAALYFHQLFEPVNGLLSSFDEVQSAGAAANRLVGLTTLDDPDAREAGLAPSPGAPSARESAAPQAADGAAAGDGDFARARTGEGATPLPSQRPSPVGSGAIPVALEGVTHAYVPGHPVLHDIDLRLAAGERVALVGTSGAGKSTLARLLTGIHRPAHGRVLLGDRPLESLRAAEVSTTITLISQETHVFAGPLRDDLRLARPGATDDEMWAALDTVRARSWAENLPDGLDTKVGQAGLRLDPIRAQQLALARLVLADPPVAVLDEATAEAGSAGSRVLEAAAERALRGRTALVVAHRLTQAVRADRVVVLEEGRIAESGTHDELVGAGGVYAGLWEAWSGART